MIKKIYKRRVAKTVKWILIVVFGFSLLCFIGVSVAHIAVFSRADYKEYASDRLLIYDDLDPLKYPREELNILSGENTLAAYLYGAENTQGLIIVSPGHRDPNDVKLYEIVYFVEAGYLVLCYDYTGCYNSEGNSMIGYTQSVYDLDAVLNYVEASEQFRDIPIMLFGHSLGGYASAAVLSFGHDVKAAVIASPFDTPKEQWLYSIERFTGVFHVPLLPFTNLFIIGKYGDNANLSAVDGINATEIPILVLIGTEDEFYGGENPVYAKLEHILNMNCIFKLMEKPNAHGHYDYFLTEKAIEYHKYINDNAVYEAIDKNIYMEHDEELMSMINEFLLSAIK